MSNFELANDEVNLYEGIVTCKEFKGSFKLTLTSKKMVLEKGKGLLKKEYEIISVLNLEDIKIYNDAVQIKQKGSDVSIQATSMDYTLSFEGMLEARKFVGKIVDATTGTTMSKRGSEKIKGALDMVDDTLGIDTRGTVKGLLENGVKGTLLNGIGKKK